MHGVLPLERPMSRASEQVRIPRVFAYWSMALLCCGAVVEGHSQLLASIAVVYLVGSPALWHAFATRASSGTGVCLVERRRGRTAPSPDVAMTCTEAIMSSAFSVFALPLSLAIAALAGLILVRVATQGRSQGAAFLLALGAGALIGVLAARSYSGAAWPSVMSVGQLAAVALWLFMLALAIAWVGNNTRQGLRVAHARASGISADIACLAQRLGRYLPPTVRQTLMDRVLHDAEVSTGMSDIDRLLDVSATRHVSQRRWLTVCFSDIVGFTAMTERLEPEEVSVLLDAYQREVSTAVAVHGGTLDKFLGDGAMVIFGDGEHSDRHADAAAGVRMAIALQAAMSGLNARLSAMGIRVGMQLRIGVASGICTVGDFGSDDRLHYTALGRAVNLASRLESAAGPGEILLAESAADLVAGELACDRAGELQVKGITWPVAVYTPRRRRALESDSPFSGDWPALAVVPQ